MVWIEELNVIGIVTTFIKFLTIYLYTTDYKKESLFNSDALFPIKQFAIHLPYAWKRKLYTIGAFFNRFSVRISCGSRIRDENRISIKVLTIFVFSLSLSSWRWRYTSKKNFWSSNWFQNLIFIEEQFCQSINCYQEGGSLFLNNWSRFKFLKSLLIFGEESKLNAIINEGWKTFSNPH